MTTDAIGTAFAKGMQELARTNELPELLESRSIACACVVTVDRNFIWHPEFCPTHERQVEMERRRLGYPKYERLFERECDAKDRASIIHNQYPVEGYGTRTHVFQVCDWWMLFGWYADSCE